MTIDIVEETEITETEPVETSAIEQSELVHSIKNMTNYGAPTE